MKPTFTLLLLCSLFAAQAQIAQIDSVTVSATRLEQPLQTSGRSATVINSEEIQSLAVNSVDELLRFVSGVNLNVRGPFGIQTDIGMRGSTFSQVLILLDNVRLNDPLTGHFNNNIPVSLAEIGQIEILRGPASTAYGTDAVGGMIHIKTKSFLAKKVAKHLTTTGQVAIGDHEMSSTDLGVYGGIGDFIYSAGYRHNIADGEDVAIPNDTSGQTYNNYFDVRSYGASLAYLPSDNLKLQIRAGRDIRDFKARYFYTASPWDDASETVNTLWYQANANYVNGNHSTEFSVGQKSTDDSYLFNPLFGGANEHHISKLYSNLNHSVALNSNSKLAVGVQLEQREIESNERGDHKNKNVGYYLVYSQFWKGLHTTAGLRYEQDDNFGNEFIPQLALAYQLKTVNFRASYGKAIRGADFTERFISSELDSSSLFPMRNVGQANLLAERSHTVDFGVNTTLFKHRIDVGIFQRNSTNLIDYVVTNSSDIKDVTNVRHNTDYLYAKNISEASTFGVELSISRTLALDPVVIQPAINYTYLKTTNADSVVSKYLANHPTHNFNFGLLINSPWVGLQLSSNTINRESSLNEVIGGEIQGTYTLMNAKLNFKLHKDALSCFVQVNNILDTEYQEILGAQLPGRWFLYGIQWNLYN